MRRKEIFPNQKYIEWKNLFEISKTEKKLSTLFLINDFNLGFRSRVNYNILLVY